LKSQPAATNSGTRQEARAEVTLTHSTGLHIRPLNRIVQLLSSREAEVRISRPGGPEVNARRALELMTLEAPCGTVLRIRAWGPDARETVEALKGLVERNFDLREE